jgi:hypothetical protein
MPRTSTGIESRKSHARSRVSNGKDLLPGIDGRSVVARRYRDISFAIFQDAGGVDQCSEARQQLIRRFAACSVIAEMMEAELANGKPINIAEHSQLSSTLTRLASRIGIERTSKDVTPPSVSDYLAHLAKEKEAEAARREADVVSRVDDVVSNNKAKADADEVTS